MSSRDPRPRPRSRAPLAPARRLVVLLPVLAGTLAGCAWLSAGARDDGNAEGPAGSRFHAALAAAGRDDFPTARAGLGELAARCDAGPWGREALLALASVELSPRNPDGSADDAAALLARYLQIPTVPPRSVALAETLYLLAVDLGARAHADPLAPAPATEGIPWSYDECGTPAEPALVRPLPEHPGPVTTAGALGEALTRLETLRARSDSLGALARDLTERNAALEAELERIRRLLLPDTARGGERPER